MNSDELRRIRSIEIRLSRLEEGLIESRPEIRFDGSCSATRHRETWTDFEKMLVSEALFSLSQKYARQTGRTPLAIRWEAYKQLKYALFEQKDRSQQ